MRPSTVFRSTRSIGPIRRIQPSFTPNGDHQLTNKHLPSCLTLCCPRYFSRGARIDVGVSPLPTGPHSIETDSTTSFASGKLAPDVVDFDPPTIITREAVAYVKCPYCHVNLHVSDMEGHLITKHGEGLENEGSHVISATDAKAMCDRRKELFEAFFGEPLVKTEEDTMNETEPENEEYFAEVGRPRVVGGSSSIENNNVAAAQMSSPLDAKIPIMVAEGYKCAICGNASNEIFKTRDAILKHLYTVHEDDDDLDAIEAKVPVFTPPARAQSPPISQSTAGGGRKPLAIGRAAKAKTEMRLHAAQITGAMNPKDAPVFKDNEFPCEICGKVYANESMLLNHIDMKHGAEFGGLGAPPKTNAEKEEENRDKPKTANEIVAELQRMEMKSGGAGSVINCKCEFCPGKLTVYKSVSSLYSHISAKHPSQDAQAVITRILEQNKDRVAGGTDASAKGPDAALECPHCNRVFATKEALDSHIVGKHKGFSELPVSASASYWCNDCEKGFSTAPGLQGHMIQKHDFVVTPMRCPACHRHMADSFACDEHVALSHPDFQYTPRSVTVKCIGCPRQFLNHDGLEVHIKKSHPNLLAEYLVQREQEAAQSQNYHQQNYQENSDHRGKRDWLQRRANNNNNNGGGRVGMPGFQHHHTLRGARGGFSQRGNGGGGGYNSQGYGRGQR